MADVIRTAQYFKVNIADKSGTLGHMLVPLREAGVNLLSVHAFPRNRRTQVDVVPEDPAAFKDIARSLKWKVAGPKVCFLVDGDDRPGVLADLTGQLGSANINLTAITGLTAGHRSSSVLPSAGQRRFGAILWVKARDVKKAAKVLDAQV